MYQKPFKISIVTPSLNQGKYIKKAINSVLQQKYPDFEHIIVDGGSTDKTVSVLKTFNDRIIWSSCKDSGQADAINKGMKTATGEILAYLNADDEYLPGAFNWINNFFQKNNHVSWVTGRCKIVDEKGKETRRFITFWKNFWLNKCYLNIPYTFSLKILNFISQPATFWRSRIYQEIGEFDKILRYTMDYDYWLRLSEKYQCGFINEDISVFRMHRFSKSSLGYSKQFNEGLQVVKRYSKSPAVIALHKIHDEFTKNVYSLNNLLQRH